MGAKLFADLVHRGPDHRARYSGEVFGLRGVLCLPLTILRRAISFPRIVRGQELGQLSTIWHDRDLRLGPPSRTLVDWDSVQWSRLQMVQCSRDGNETVRALLP